MLSKERANAIAQFLSADEERASKLVALEPSDALAQINALGNDFTLEEINAYADAVRSAATQGELDSESLDSVSGGSILVAAATIVAAMIVSRAW